MMENKYKEKHMVKAVDSSLYAKNRLAVPCMWRLLACINRPGVRMELDCVVYRCWGTLGAGAALLYFIQRYTFIGGEPYVNIPVWRQHQVESDDKTPTPA